MKKLFHLLLLSSTILMATESNETPINVPKEVTTFIPTGYSILNFTKGDLNRDKWDDAILILKKKDEQRLADINDSLTHRPLYILIGNRDGTYQKVAENNNSVLGVNDGGMMGDPFQGVTIKNGYFSVEHYGGSSWRWTHIVTFKYNTKKKSWFLHKDGGDSFHSSNPNKMESKVSTVKDFGVVKFEDYTIFE